MFYKSPISDDLSGTKRGCTQQSETERVAAAHLLEALEGCLQALLALMPDILQVVLILLVGVKLDLYATLELQMLY